MTTVLIALDDSDASHLAALTATALFGPDASYFAVYAQPSTPAGPVMWGPVFAYTYPTILRARLDDQDSRDQLLEEARSHAEQQSEAIGIDATPIGEVGDPAEAIERAADDHGADVVVVGTHQRGWFRRLFDGSVSNDLVARSRLPVLVVPSPTDE